MRPPVILEAAGLRLTLVPCGDRLAHSVGLVLPDRVVPLLASLEGSPGDDWPPSPPLTAVEPSPGASPAQALLLGVAGRGHWSAALQVNLPQRAIEFEVACRSKQRPAWLGSSYRTMVAAESVSQGGQSAELNVAGHIVRVAAVGGSVHITPEGLKIAVEPAEGPYPHTVRWNYSVCRVS